MAAAWMGYGLTRPGTLRSPLENGSSATPEYVAHVLLARPDAAAERTLAGGESPAINIATVGEKVAGMFAWLPVWFAFQESDGDPDSDPYLALRTFVYGQRLMLQSLVYEWEEEATLRALLDPSAADLKRIIGFDAEQATALTKAAFTVQIANIDSIAEEARGFADAARTLLDAHLAGVSAASAELQRALPAGLVDELEALSPSDRSHQIDLLAMTGMAAHLGRKVSFTPDQLAAAAGVDPAVAATFLKRRSTEFGEPTDEHAVGTEVDFIRSRPILHDGSGRYLAVAGDTAFFGLRDLLVDVLKGEQKAWKRFDKRRGEVLEDRALAALTTAVSADWGHTGVKFQFVDQSGQLKNGESDGILRFQDTVVLIEAKAGGLPPSARRLDPVPLEKALRQLIRESHDQLRIAHEALILGGATNVTDKNHRPLELDLEGVSRVIRVSVSLEDLASVCPAVWQLQDAGILPTDEELPWTVGIHELEMICRLAESSAQLIHYILRRLRTYRQKIWGMDELDFWMVYLANGLYWEDDPAPGLTLDNHTDPLDAWVYGERGVRPKAEKPRQRIDGTSLKLLRDIEATGADGRLEAQLMVLESNSDTRKAIAYALRRLSKRSSRDGLPHDETRVFAGDMAITVEGLPAGHARMSSEQFAAYGREKMREHGLRRWLGLTTRANRAGKIERMAILLDLDRLNELSILKETRPTVLTDRDRRGIEPETR